MRLLTAFHLPNRWADGMDEPRIGAILEVFVEHRQKDWPEWLVSADFVVNNKVHTAMKVLPSWQTIGEI